jgi:hypothetical protein
LVAVAAVATVALLIFANDLGDEVAGIALRVVFVAVVLIGFLLIAALFVAHEIESVRGLYRATAYASRLQADRRRRRELDAARGVGPPVAIKAPNADRALVLGVVSLFFPWVGPWAIWYGRDALKRVRMSGGSLAGRRKALAGLILGVVTTTALGLLLAYGAAYLFAYYQLFPR